MKITLIGYMGSGKSSVGHALSGQLGVPFMDLDDEISKGEGLSVSEIFKTKGEIYFRKKEREYLHECLKNERFILSAGGGTPAYYDNIAVMNRHSDSIFLRAKVSTLAQRLINEKQNRPLIQRLSEDELSEYVAKHLFERNPFYQQARYILDIEELSIDAIVKKILLLDLK